MEKNISTLSIKKEQSKKSSAAPSHHRIKQLVRPVNEKLADNDFHHKHAFIDRTIELISV